jgi:hypothetical protein
MHCPKCGFEQPAGSGECARCGIVFSKWHEGEELPPAISHAGVAPPAPVAQSIAAGDLDDDVPDGRIGRKELTILGSGLAAAAVIYVLPFTRFIFSALVTLFHELGHAVVGWLLGHPSLPAFDFVYGGGFTHMGEFHLSIAVAIAAAIAFGGWTFRRNARTLVVLGVIALIWLFFVSAEWRRELAVASAGHAFEFILASIFFYQALAGVGWQIPELERPLGAFAAFFVQIHSMLFAFRLRNDADFLALYREGKGGALMNDLEVVALDLNIYLGFNPGIRGVAGMLIVFSFVPFTVALIWYLFRSRSHRFVVSLLQVES